MACAITVDHSATTGFTVAGVLQEIYVQGTAINCGSVKISITCGGVSFPPATVAVNPTTPYMWFYTFKNIPAPCQCNGQFSIKVECADKKESCTNDDYEQLFDLPCKPKPGAIPICPPVNWNIGAMGNCQNGKRAVSVFATIQGTGAYSAELRDKGNNLLDTKTGTGPLTLTFTGSFPGGTTQTFHVTLTKPAGCPGSSQSIAIPSCESPEVPSGSGSWGMQPPSIGGIEEPKINPGPYEPKQPPQKPGPVTKKSSKCGSMVWIVGVLLALAASLTALTLAWYFCVPGSVPPAWIWATVVGVGIAAGLAIATWYILCALVPDCECPTKCDWLQIGTMVALAGAAILAWLGACCPTWLIAASFGAAYLGALAGWIAACKPTTCYVLAAHLTAIVSGAAPAIAYIIWVPQIAACGSTLVNAVVATVGAILAAATAASCAAASKNP
ncbi:MAG: hypothetical protein KC449_25130 [Anaerolineales bacterium]|nr:hypothetical protein [Anaerolineales bacterium]